MGNLGGGVEKPKIAVTKLWEAVSSTRARGETHDPNSESESYADLGLKV